MHVQQNEADPGKRAFTRDELQAFFDHADEQVVRIRGRRAARAGCRRSATPRCSRSPTRSGCGATRPGCSTSSDFGRNPHGAEFGEYGVCYVRHGKAKKGSPPKRRSVLTVWAWGSEVLAGVDHRGPARLLEHRRQPGGLALRARRRGSGWPRFDSRFAAYRDDARPRRRAGLPLAAPLLRHAPDRGRLGRRCSCSSRSGTNTPPRPRSTPACPRTSAPAPCAGALDATLAAALETTDGGRREASGPLPVAAARDDGRQRHVHRDRARACPLDHGTGSRSQILIEATSMVPRNTKSRLS